MDILGIGGLELLVILLIMVTVAGPKRMIQWSYKLGQYVTVLRNMWKETAQTLQKELDGAGVDFKVPTEPPTRQSLQREMQRAIAPVTRPIQESLDDVQGDLNSVKQAASLGSWTPPKPRLQSEGTGAGAGNPYGAQPATPTPEPAVPPANGSAPAPAAPPKDGDGGFGTWSGT